jgi:hypothetical protein
MNIIERILAGTDETRASIACSYLDRLSAASKRVGGRFAHPPYRYGTATRRAFRIAADQVPAIKEAGLKLTEPVEIFTPGWDL